MGTFVAVPIRHIAECNVRMSEAGHFALSWEPVLFIWGLALLKKLGEPLFEGTGKLEPPAFFACRLLVTPYLQKTSVEDATIRRTLDILYKL
jgi:hypothetical protein